MTMSYIRNCRIVPRGGDTLFQARPRGALLVRLDGYAIVPLEVFNAMEHQIANLEEQLFAEQQSNISFDD